VPRYLGEARPAARLRDLASGRDPVDLIEE